MAEKKRSEDDQRADWYQQRMIDSTYRSLRMVTEMQVMAIDTTEEVKKQREQLKRTKKNLDKTHGDLSETGQNLLTSAKGFSDTTSNWFKKPLKNKTDVNDKIRKGSDKKQKNVEKLDHTTCQSWDNDNLTNDAKDEIIDHNLSQIRAELEVLNDEGRALGNALGDKKKKRKIQPNVQFFK